ncbi:unnamed protein product, partial [Meganyctiphanes norvegica]
MSEDIDMNIKEEIEVYEESVLSQKSVKEEWVCNPSDYDKAFSQKNGPVKHKNTPEEKKSYQCNQCDSFFSRKSHLIQHQRTHTGAKPYQCDQCDKCFSMKGDLTRHHMTHSG